MALGGRPAGFVGSAGLTALTLALFASPVPAGPAEARAAGLGVAGAEREPLRATLRQGTLPMSRESAEAQEPAPPGPPDVRTRRLSDSERLRLREQLRASPEAAGPRRSPLAAPSGLSGPTDRRTP